MKSQTGSSRIRAFTLVELMVVLAILAILAGVLFPVLRSAQNYGEKTTCLSRFRQVGTALQLYLGDYDDRYVVVSHRPGQPADSRYDRTWVQLVMPYVRGFTPFLCPSDHTKLPPIEATFDRDLVPGDTLSRFYTASMRVNTGLNYLYLSPVIFSGGTWLALPRGASEVDNPSQTVALVDSVWSLTAQGTPEGGGSWLVMPPCRFANESGSRVDTFPTSDARQNLSQVMISGPTPGWQTDGPPTGLRFGGAWPWHSGRMTVLRADLSAQPMTPRELSDGCFVLPAWQGQIFDRTLYPWDLR